MFRVSSTDSSQHRWQGLLGKPCFESLTLLGLTLSTAGCGEPSKASSVGTTTSSLSLGSNATSGGASTTGPSAEAKGQATSDGTAGGSATGTTTTPLELDLRIYFDAKVGQAPFACAQRFQGVGFSKREIDPVDFRFYVHDLRLLDLQGREVPVSIPDREIWQGQGVALLDFENDAGGCRFGGDPGLNDLVTGSVPFGTYRGLRFRLGVPKSLNHQDPLTLGALFQSGGMQWNWLTGFKFLAIEFRSGESSGLLHIGSRACTGGGPQAVECSKGNLAEVFLPDFVPGRSRIAADLGAVFANSDLSVDQICHSDGERCAPMFAQAGLSWESGATLDVQSFFSTVDQAAR